MTDSWYICNIMKMSQFLSFAIMLAFLPSCGTGRSGSCLFPDSAAISLRSQIEDAAQFPLDFDIAGLHEKYEKARYGESG